MKRLPASFGLGGKLLLLLLAFGLIPLVLSIVVGYTVSRAVIIESSERALRELTDRQAVHVATELTRQRLLLRTITSQLRGIGFAEEDPTEPLALLARSMPEDGVFDGLRVVQRDGRITSSAALGHGDPFWPAEAPAADWLERRAAIHREGHHIIAYLIAVPLDGEKEGTWLEGHVREENFARLFSLPEHMAGSIEPAIFENTGLPIVIGHHHAEEGLIEAFGLRAGDSLSVVRADVESRPSLVATAPIAGSDWYFVAALPLEIALSPLARLRDTAIVSTLILIALILAIGAIAARSVTTPLRELAGAALHFGKRGVYRELRPRGRDEVGLLVRSFNRMTADLERSREEIERLHARDMERAEQLATVGELASGVAHEIRNPLTGVRGALELAVRKLPLDDPSRSLLEEADRQLERIEDTTTQLLHYARPPELREVVVDANHLVGRALHLVEAKARNAAIDLQVESPAAEAPVCVDPELMVQVLVNLMLNGIEAMRGSGQLAVRIQRNDTAVSISVSDTGPGIRQEDRQNIFRPFFTTKHQGTGLGLSISRQIITRHGGTVTVHDTPGGGATFVVALPLGQEEDGGSRQQ